MIEETMMRPDDDQPDNDTLPEWKDLKSADLRHRIIRQLASRACQHQFGGTAHVTEFRPIYRVDGRRRNGSVVGKDRFQWLAGRILLPIRSFALSLIGFFFGDISVVYRRNVVAGQRDCSAARFADANSAEQQALYVDPLWLVWSPDRAILAKVVDESPTRLEVIWGAQNTDAPRVDPAARVLSWRDGSSVTFERKSWDVLD
ncbi:MAG: hypothetical protein ACRDQ5_20065 [Sciscionella sp.]